MYKELFVQRLKLALEMNNMRQKELAEKLNLSAQSISTYLSLENNTLPHLETLVSITEELNISLDWLLGKEKVKQTPLVDIENLGNKLYIPLMSNVILENKKPYGDFITMVTKLDLGFDYDIAVLIKNNHLSAFSKGNIAYIDTNNTLVIPNRYYLISIDNRSFIKIAKEHEKKLYLTDDIGKSISLSDCNIIGAVIGKTGYISYNK